MSDLVRGVTSLNDEQKVISGIFGSPVCVIAGAGTGKTTTIANKVAVAVRDRKVSRHNVLLLAHGRKAAGEINRKINALGVSGVAVRTFHSAALKQLKYFWDRAGKSKPLEVRPDRYAAVRSIMKSLGMPYEKEYVVDVINEIGWAKCSLVGFRDYVKASASRRTSIPQQSIAEVYERYEHVKNVNGILDFEDILLELCHLIENDPDIAKQIRTTYNSFVVDEFQDIDPLQLRLLDAWIGDSKDVTVVGDPRQSIYGFKGAYGGAFDWFMSRFPDGQVFNLVKNYRSGENIVEAANNIAGVEYADLVGMKQHDFPVKVVQVPSENDETKLVVKNIKILMRDANVRAGSFAVLSRFNSQLLKYEAELRKEGVPYKVEDGASFFKKQVIRDIMNQYWKELRIVKDKESVVGIELLNWVLSSVFSYDRNSPPSGQGAVKERWETITAFLELTENIPGIWTLGADYLLKEFKVWSEEEYEPSSDYVTLSTVHKAKGLEWDYVYITDFVEGSYPSSYAETRDDKIQELNIFYVAVTRAKVKATCVSPAKNSQGWTLKPSSFKPFLTERSVVSDSGDVKTIRASQFKRVVKISHCKKCGLFLPDALQYLGWCLMCAPISDVVLSEDLVTLRKRIAVSRSVKPNNVFSDETIWKLVVAKPRNKSVLLEVAPELRNGDKVTEKNIRAILSLIKK